MSARLIFRGAAGTVTGSCYEIVHDRGRFLVDCGMFQGNRTTRALNFEPFPFVPGEVDFVLLTHAHIDHSGLIPKLSRQGFAGRVHATRPTLDLLGAMLPDSGAIQESDVERLNRRRQRRGEAPVQPIYGVRDAEAALDLLVGHELERWVEAGPGVRARFWNAGHMLGSASIEIALDAGGDRPLRLLFSGDLGPDEKAFHRDPEAPEGFDHLILESTYGDRDRADATLGDRREALGAEIRDALGRGGNLVIPCFAVERSQELLLDIDALLRSGAVPRATVFLDSPLAGRITEVFRRNAAAMPGMPRDGRDPFANPAFRITEGVEDSMAINRIRGGAIIISASGMAEAGRVKHHLRNNLWRPEATVLFVGYQAPGTLGALLLGGAERVRIHDRDVEVRATIRSIGSYSAHADQRELIAWALERRPVAGTVFLTHGEEPARAALRDLLAARGFEREAITLPQLDDAYALAGASAVLAEPGGRRAEPEALASDWVDAQFAFDRALRRALDAAPDDAARARLIARLGRTLEGG